MGQSIHDVLLALGAKNVRDPGTSHPLLALDLELLDVRSLFGGALTGEAVLQVSTATAFAFQKPKELAQCGTLWLPGVETVEALSQAIVDAHDTLRARLDDDQQSLKKLGFKPRLIAPEPRARAQVDVDGDAVQVAIDANGDVVLELVGGRRVPSEHGRVFSPEDVDAAEAHGRLAAHMRELGALGVLDDDDDLLSDVGAASTSGDGFDVEVDEPGADPWNDEGSSTASVPSETQATRPLSDEQLAELAAALDDDDAGGLLDEDESDEAMIDASAEAEPVHAGDDDDGRAAPPPRAGASDDEGGGRDGDRAGEPDDDRDDEDRARSGNQADADDADAADDDGLFDGDREDTAAGAPIPQGPERARDEARNLHPRVDIEDDDDGEPKTVSMQARKPSSLLDALDREESEGEDEPAAVIVRRGGFTDEMEDEAAEDDSLAGDDSLVAVARAGGDPLAADDATGAVAGEEDGARLTIAADDDDNYDEPTVSALGSLGGRTVSERETPVAARAALAAAAAAIQSGASAAFGDAFGDDEDVEGALAATAGSDEDELNTSPQVARGGALDEDGVATRGDSGALAARARADKRAARDALSAGDEDDVAGFASSDDGDDHELAAPAAGARASAGDAAADAADAGDPARDHADDEPFAAGELRVDDFPALPLDSADAEPAPTTVMTESAGPNSIPPTAIKRGAVVRTSDEDVESVAAGFDDGEGLSAGLAARHGTPRPGPLTVEEPAVDVPTRGTVSLPAEPAEMPPSAAGSAEGPDRDDRDEGLVSEGAGRATDARALAASGGAGGASGFEDESDEGDLEDALVARLGAADDAPAARAAAARAADPYPGALQVPIGDDEDEDPNTARTRALFISGVTHTTNTNTNNAGANTNGARLTVHETGEVSVNDPDVLEARAGALEEEARALRERAVALRQAAERRPATTMSLDPSLGAGTSLPILASMEVHEVNSDDPTAALNVDSSSAEIDVAQPPIGRVDGGAAKFDTPGPRGLEIDLDADAGDLSVGEDGVSLAEVQAALGDVGALSGEQTHVGALSAGKLTDLRANSSGEGGDVFESAFAEPSRKPRETPTQVKDHDAKPRAPEAPGDNVDGFAPSIDTRLIDAAPAGVASPMAAHSGAIGLVVEDPRARDRLKKHLTPRFRRLVEAPDAMTAASLPEVDGVEALVFVRPRPDDATREGIVQLCDGPLPPRILIISSDARFDEMPEVSLRLPLGQRASEVAQQVLDGLRTLGVETIEASE